MNSVDELKLRLIDAWNSLQQNVIDAAINEWRKWLRACVCADGKHFVLNTVKKLPTGPRVRKIVDK